MTDVEIGSRWLHTNGNKYTVLMITNLESTRLEEYPIMVVYKGDNGHVWSRKLVDWHRSMSKMTPIPPEWKHEYDI